MPQITGHYTPGLDDSDRLSRIISALSSSGSDVICLQEVHSEKVLKALEQGLAGKYRILATHRANIPARFALETIHVLCGVVVLLVSYLASFLVPSVLAEALRISMANPNDDLDHVGSTVALSAVAISELGFIVPFVLGYWGGRQWIRASALSNFLRCSVHGGLATLYNPSRLRVRPGCEPETLVFSEQSGDLLNLFKPRGATGVVFEPAVQAGEAESAKAAAAIVICNVHMNLGECRP